MKSIKVTKSDLKSAELSGCKTAEDYWIYIDNIKKTKSNDIEILSLLFISFSFFILYFYAINENNNIIEIIGLFGFILTGYYSYQIKANKDLLNKIKELIVLPSGLAIFIYILKLTYGSLDVISQEIKVEILISFLLFITSFIYYIINKNHLMLSGIFIFFITLIESLNKFYFHNYESENISNVIYNYSFNNKLGLIFSILTLISINFYFKNNIQSLKYVAVLSTLYYFSELILYNYRSLSVLIPITILFLNAYKYKFKENDNDYDCFLIVLSIISIVFFDFFKIGTLFNLTALIILFWFSFKNNFNKLLLLISIMIIIYTENLINIDNVLYEIIYYIVFGLLIFFINKMNNKYRLFKNNI